MRIEGKLTKGSAVYCEGLAKALAWCFWKHLRSRRPAPKLICLDSSLSSLCPWRQSIAAATFRSTEVAKLRDGLLSICPWPVEAFSNDWSAIPDAHEYVSLISSFQPSVAETGEYHIFLDGSFIPSTGVGAWAFSIVLRTVEGGRLRASMSFVERA